MRHVRMSAFLLVLLVTPMLFAQTPPEGNKAKGEELQIKARDKWFIESRQLDKVDRPDQKRRNAVENTRARRNNQAAMKSAHLWYEVGPSPMTMFSWTMGNVAGRVSAIDYDPTDTDTLYLGTASGGLWKTTNGGASWTSMFDDVGTQTIGVVYVEPGSPTSIWAGTGEQSQSCTAYFGMGLFKSEDGGLSWTAKNGSGGNTLDLSFVNAVAVAPTNNQLVLAGGHGYCDQGTYLAGGLYRSIDSGDSWTMTLSGAVNDIIMDPGNPNIVYTAVGSYDQAENGIHKSIDGGQTWTQLTNGIAYGTGVGRVRLAMAPSNSAVLYALMNQGGTYIYKTTNGGSSWSTQNTNACEGQCWYNLCIDVHPTDPNTILVGSIRFALSTNSGQTLSYQTSSWGAGQKVHQDTHVVLFHPSDGNSYWVGCDGGIWNTTNNGSTYNNLNANLNITQLYDIAVHPSDPNTIFGGAQDNSSQRTNGSLEWDVTVVSGDGFMNLVDPLNPAIVYQTSYAYAAGRGYLPRIYRSNSGGNPGTFVSFTNNGIKAGSFGWVVPLAIEANSAGNETHIFTAAEAPYRKTESDRRWNPMATGSATGGTTIRVIEPTAWNNDMVVYVGNDSGVYRTDNGLANSPSWQNVTGNYPGGRVTDIAVDDSDPMRVFVTRGAFGQSRLYRSTTGGSNWTAVGAGLPDAPANTVAIDPLAANRIYVGTDAGVFESSDNGDSFTPMMNGFPLGVPVQDLEITAAPYILSAGTYGRGVWQTVLTSAGTKNR